MFENVDGRRTDGRRTDGRTDGRRTDDGRTTDAGVTGILLAHLGAFDSGELKIIHIVSILDIFTTYDSHLNKIAAS